MVVALVIYNLPMFKSTITTPKEPKKVGILMSIPGFKTAAEGFKKAMTDTGFAEGKDIIYEEWLYTRKPEELKTKVQEFTDKKFDLILAAGTSMAGPAFDQTAQNPNPIPLIFISVDDPIGRKIIKDFKSSGTHATGVESNVASFTAKSLEYIRRIDPTVKKVGFFGDGYFTPGGPGRVSRAELLKQLPLFGMTPVEFKTGKPSAEEKADSVRAAFQKLEPTVKRSDIDALYHIGGHFYDEWDKNEAGFAKRLKIVHVVNNLAEVKEGGLISVSPDHFESGRQAAVMAQKIFGGVAPTNIPVESPRRISVTLNLETARISGFKIPDDILSIADVKVGK